MDQELPVEDSWFAVRCHFRLPPSEWRSSQTYEERITLWQAGGLDEAIALAESEALDYIEGTENYYINACSAFHLFEGGFGVSGKEVFSQMRKSDLDPTTYLDTFFFTGEENCAP